MEVAVLVLLGFFAVSIPAMFLLMAILDAIFGDESSDDLLLHQEDYEPKNVKR